MRPRIPSGAGARSATLLAIALVLACARGGGCAERSRPPGGVPPLSREAAAPAVIAPAQPQELSGKVVRVRDGDSLVVLAGGRGVEVRLDGVDAPELAQAFGRKARRFTSELAFGREVRVIGKGRDKYDRVLAEVLLPDGRSLNRELVSAGQAWWFRRYSSDRDLEGRERRAREERRGLWADTRPVPPWDFRDARPARGGRR